MPQVHFVQKARKDYPGQGIKKDEPYYWWKFRHGGRFASKTRPRPSQLTQSDYLSTAYSLQERIEDLKIDPEDLEDVADELRSAAGELRTLGNEQEDKIGNMPDSLQDSEVAERLRNSADACESVASELESAANEIVDLKGRDDLKTDDRIRDAAQAVLDNITWDVDPY